MRSSFTHLHVHSYYSMLGATASPAALAARAARAGMQRLALTDLNGLYGAVAFQQACRAQGVQPIIGMTITLAWPLDESRPLAAGPGRLVLLAKDGQGYRSLCRLSTLIQGAPDREQRAARGLTWSDLQAQRAGLLCLSGGRMGWIERCLRAGQAAAAGRIAGRLAKLFGEDFALALEIHSPRDLHVARALAEMAARLGVPSAAVAPVYCLEPAQAELLPLLAAIAHNTTLAELDPQWLPGHGDRQVGLHWLEAQEMARRYSEFPAALEAAGRLAERCGPALPDGRPLWPELDLPAGAEPLQALQQLARQGLRERYGPRPPAEAGPRLEHELQAIARTGFTPLFLIMADVARFARQAGIPMNTRGSVANSLVAYCVGISQVDPLAHDLYFERFLNPARRDLPDIDLDFCSKRRDEVLRYVRQRYGQDRVALIGTVNTFRPRSALRETGKALGMPEGELDRLAGLVPGGHRRRPALEELLAKVEDARQRQVVVKAWPLVGLPHHLSVHPGGVVIAPTRLTDVVPLQWAPKGFLITQYDHRHVGAIGLPKLDLLGVRALTVVAEAERLVQRHRDPQLSLQSIPPEDRAAGELIARGETVGVFQCESRGAQRTLRRLRARTAQDLAVANAFFKPGPAAGGMARSFERRYRGEEPVRYLHPALKPILGVTKGVLIFQEQVLRIARQVAGLSWEDANRLRRGMSKFKPQEMRALEQEFVRGCQRPPPHGPGMDESQARRLWEQVVAFSGYGFNQGHATAYAAVSYRMAYLKAHFPAEFLCARLANRGGYHHPAIYMAEARRLGIQIRPPHVNVSGAAFTLTYEAGRPVLWLGLGQVRDLRRSAVEAMIEARAGRPFESQADLAARVRLQRKELVHLVQCGALDGLGPSRRAMLQQLRGGAGGQPGQLALPLTPITAQRDSAAEILAWERALLGMPVSVHPLDLLGERLGEHVPLRELPQHPGERVRVVGVRLPGWTGDGGFFFADRESYLVARAPDGGSALRPWQPHWLQGRWQHDGMGTWWLEVLAMGPLAEGG